MDNWDKGLGWHTITSIGGFKLLSCLEKNSLNKKLIKKVENTPKIRNLRKE